MCGIAGIFHPGNGTVHAPHLRRMLHCIEHRGPDDEGIAALGGDGRLVTVGADDPQGATAIVGSRRLAIIDLSPSGHQPMMSEDGRLVIVFNGEVYNFRQLRAELEDMGHQFRSRSDTEVVLRGYEAWGERVVGRLNGMFAFAILDMRAGGRGSLFLARDRFGQKPLYYAWVEGAFVFASEMKALLELHGVDRTIAPEAVEAYLTYLWVPEPGTILAGVSKLPAGHMGRVTERGLETRAYWRLQFRAGPSRPIGDLALELRRLLRDAVERTVVADVPVSVLLSGGLDSSTITHFMVASGNPPSVAYAIGVPSSDQALEGMPDDLPFARAMAEAARVPLRERVLDPAMVEELPKVVWHLDEPLADPAVLPLLAMCREARGRSKVVLSGMGGDEVFGGYRRHVAARWARLWRMVPGPLRRRILMPLVERLPSAGGHALAPAFRRAKRVVRAFEDPAGLAWGLAAWSTPAERRALLAPRARDSSREAPVPAASRGGEGFDEVLAFDASVYLPSHNLNYTDKIGMAASVEIRAPLLDNEVVDFMAQVPSRHKTGLTGTKLLLRAAMDGVLPASILARRKTGLGAPIRSWLLGPLQPLASEVLSPARLSRRGLFAPEGVQRLWDDLRSGREDTSYLLWAVMVLELWMDAFDARLPWEEPRPGGATP